eukprot:COSAG06_NODE_7364_length_2527_cov_4.258949_1_plen_43_part_10
MLVKDIHHMMADRNGMKVGRCRGRQSRARQGRARQDKTEQGKA